MPLFLVIFWSFRLKLNTSIAPNNITIISINESKPKVRVFIVLDIPRIIRMLKIFDPITLPIAISSSPFFIETILVTSSGSDKPY